MSATAGHRHLTVADAHAGTAIATHVLYPSAAPERDARMGPYAMSLAPDAEPAGARSPLVVISHGTGGTPLVYRGLAAHLARAGFVVALPTHPGNNRGDDSLANSIENLEGRPRHLRLLIDALFADAALGPRLLPDRVGVVGHSMGGYTALAIAGGRPAARAPDGASRTLAVEHDPRVRALVLLAPAVPWFMGPGALARVHVPILMLTGEHDQATSPWHAQVVTRGLPATTRIEHRVVAGAGHFAFLTPFPPERVGPDFPPSQDPPGFDRVAFQETLCADVEAFLRRTL
jgi:predicted dienelactone hydrolase